MVTSSVLTPDAKKEARAKIKVEMAGHISSLFLLKAERRQKAREIKDLSDAMAKLDREIAKAETRIELSKRSYETMSNAETKPVTYSKNGKRLGRPPFTEEQKAARKAARAATGEPAAPVTVPADLQPLIKAEDALSGDTPINSVKEAVS